MPDEQPGSTPQEKRCRICFDGPEAEPDLGRLIRPCLCKGSISYVHIKCLQKWRNQGPSNAGAFFSCPQCRYKYRFARTWIVGIATNPVVVGGISGLVFTFIVMLASFITTNFMYAFEEPSYSYISVYYVSPFAVARDLIRAALRILQDGDVVYTFGEVDRPSNVASHVKPLRNPTPPGLLVRLFRRFVLGLPIVAAGSVVHMLLSVPFLGPVQWLARVRGDRRRGNAKDIAALVIVVLLILGALRALYKVYQLTQTMTKRVLLRAEEAILEVD